VEAEHAVGVGIARSARNAARVMYPVFFESERRVLEGEENGKAIPRPASIATRTENPTLSTTVRSHAIEGSDDSNW